MKLNLDAKTNEERKVKAYLEANASEILTKKINNGVRIQKDGKTLLNKKTLAGFMKFACDEAKKQAEKTHSPPALTMTSCTVGRCITLRSPSKVRSTTRTAPNTRNSPAL